MNIGMTLGVILLALAVCAIVFLVLAATVCRKRWGHDILGWHDCDAGGFDGVSFTGKCKYCGKECMMDSQGNWF